MLPLLGWRYTGKWEPFRNTGHGSMTKDEEWTEPTGQTFSFLFVHNKTITARVNRSNFRIP